MFTAHCIACVTVMLNSVNFRVMTNYKLIGEITYVSDSPSSRTPPFTCCYLGPSTVSSFIEYSIFYFPFTFLTIECKLPHFIDKLHPLAQVHVSLLITVQWYTVITNFDNFEAT